MSRNVTEARGPIITLNDVVGYARRRCSQCGGTGVMRRRAPGEKQTLTSACGCAAQAFDRAHPEAIILQDGTGYWPSVLAETRAFSPDGIQAHQLAPESTIPPSPVPTPQPEANASQNASPAVWRTSRLQVELTRAQGELQQAQALVEGAASGEREALTTAEDLVLAQTQDIAALHHGVSQVGAQITQLEEQLAALREAQEHLISQRSELSEALDTSWSVVREAEERVKVAGFKFRPRVRKAQERVDQLTKRLARVKAEVGQ